MKSLDIKHKTKAVDLIKEDIKRSWLPLSIYLLYAFTASFFVGEVCPSKLIFGLPCAGCGMIRATILFSTLHFEQAVKMHPGVLMLPLYSILFIYFRYIKQADTRVIKIITIIALAILILIYLVRMLVSFGQIPLDIYENALLFRYLSLFD